MRNLFFISLIAFNLFLPLRASSSNERESVTDQSSLASNKAIQLFRKFDSISFIYKTEESKDNGKKWELVERVNVVVDERIGIRLTKIVSIHEKNVVFAENFAYNGKSITLSGTFRNEGNYKHDTFLGWDLGDKLQHCNITIQKGVASGFPMLFDEIRYLSHIDEKNLFLPNYSVYQFDNSEGKSILEIKEKSMNVPGVLWFDAKTGALLQYRLHFEDGKNRVIASFDRHKNINGWNIPLIKIVYNKRFNRQKKIFEDVLTRYTIEENNISINTLPERNISAYSIKIPIGANVRDTVNGISYKQPAINDTLSKETISSELDKMLEEGKKIKEPAKKKPTTGNK